MKLLVNIDVADLAAAERFYVVAFGLRAARRLGDHVLELAGADVAIYLLENASGSTAANGTEDNQGTTRDYGRHWTPIHIDVVVEDLDAALSRALTAGALQEGAVRNESWGRIVQVADPFGHGWCLLQFSEQGYDAIAT